MQPDDDTRLHHIIEYGGYVEQLIAGRKREDLDSDIQLSLALVRALQIIGEAATKVSDAFRQQHPELPWAQLAGMRNRLVHAYFDVNRDIVWNAATMEVPPLLEQVRAILGTD